MSPAAQPQILLRDLCKSYRVHEREQAHSGNAQRAEKASPEPFVPGSTPGA